MIPGFGRLERSVQDALADGIKLALGFVVVAVENEPLEFHCALFVFDYEDITDRAIEEVHPNPSAVDGVVVLSKEIHIFSFLVVGLLPAPVA